MVVSVRPGCLAVCEVGWWMPTAFASCRIFRLAPQIAPEMITVAKSPVTVNRFHLGQDATIVFGATVAGVAGGLVSLGWADLAASTAGRAAGTRGLGGGGMARRCVTYVVGYVKRCESSPLSPSITSR